MLSELVQRDTSLEDHRDRVNKILIVLGAVVVDAASAKLGPRKGRLPQGS